MKIIDELPREKAIRLGINSLSTRELIALIISTGTSKGDVFDLSNKVMKILNCNYTGDSLFIELNKVYGIGEAKALKICSALELSKRTNRGLDIRVYKQKIKNPESIVKSVLPEFNKNVETLIVLFLDSQNRVISRQKMFSGTIDSVQIFPREIFIKGLSYNARSFVIAHNHPSGDPSPSQSDIFATKKLQQLGIDLNLTLLDHVIICNETIYYSMAANNLI